MKSFKEFMNETATTSKPGKYVAVKVKNNKELFSFFKAQGIDVINPEDLHTTIAYSRKDFPYTVDNSEILIHPSSITGFKLFGNAENILVLTFKSKELELRHNNTLKNGAEYDYASYEPHITLDYNYDKNKQGSVYTLKIPTFPITLYAEYVEPLDEEYSV